jgi:beta-galactosidase
MDFYQSTLFNKEIYEINLMPQRSYFDVHNSIQLLNAGWHGIYAEAFTPELLQWLDGKNAISELDSVEVGLAPELQGYGKLQYANTQYPFDGLNPGKMGEAIELPNPCMLYVTDYQLNDKSLEHQYILNFQGSESGLFLYVNNQFVGYSENLYLDSEFDLTPYLENGSNRIGDLCFKYCSSTWLLDQDFYRFSGFNLVIKKCCCLYIRRCEYKHITYCHNN